MNEHLAVTAREALTQIEPLTTHGWEPAHSIARQLRWCLAFALGEQTEPRPGPFTMGLIATREFDMYGDKPELARLINSIQREAERALV